MTDILKAVVIVVLIISSAGCVGNLSFEGQEPKISDEIPQDNYQLVSSGSIEKTISREDLETKEDAYIKSQFKLYNISSTSSTKSSINSISKSDSNQNISETSEEELDSLVNTTKLAEKDSALTEESIQNLLENNISMKEIVDDSDVEVESVINKNKSLDKSDSSVSDAQINEGLTYIVISTPIIKTPDESVYVGSTKPEYILSKANITDNISVGEKVKTINEESGSTEVKIYEGTVENSGNLEIAVSSNRKGDNQFISLGYYNPRIESRKDVVNLIEDTDAVNS